MEQGHQEKQEYTMENPFTIVLQFNFAVSYGWYFLAAAAASFYFAYRLLENYKQWKEAQYRKIIKKLLEQKERERQQQLLLEAQRALELQKEKEREERQRQQMDRLQIRYDIDTTNKSRHGKDIYTVF